MIIAGPSRTYPVCMLSRKNTGVVTSTTPEKYIEDASSCFSEPMGCLVTELSSCIRIDIFCRYLLLKATEVHLELVNIFTVTFCNPHKPTLVLRLDRS